MQPPGPAENVCVSSMISSVPASRVSSRIPAWKPSSGWMIPMLVIAGSASTQATSPSESAARSASRSLNSIARVVSAGSTGGPTLPSRAWVTPSASPIANASSTEPW